MQPIEQLYDSFSQAADVAAINDRLADALADMGFARLAYRAVNLGGALGESYFNSNYPAAWLAQYEERRYITVDPIFIAGERSVLPFRWGIGQQVGARTKSQQNFFLEAQEFGIRNGVTVPVHGAGHEFATFTVASGVEANEFAKVCAERASALHLIAHYYHNALRQRLHKSVPRERPHLTPRERECLLWTAQGKTAWEISRILGIADGTVVFHLKNATRKFDVFNKYHAVVKAIMQGVIRP